MSQEWVIRTLVGLGLKRTDAKVYLFLAKTGPQKARDITNALKMNKQQLYRSLKSLRSKGIASATTEHPARFSVIPLEKVLDLFVKAKMEEAQSIEQNKDELLFIWQSMTTADSISS
jgi:sugar-specific transcriptional regulator TrmB